MSDQDSQKKPLKVEVLEKMGQLAVSGFGLVAALAWNDFIKGLFARIFPKPDNNLAAMFGYAAVITVFIVVITIQLGKLLEKTKRTAGKNQIEK